MHRAVVAMGFRPTVRIVKMRRTGSLGALVLCVDEFDGLGVFLEVERMVPDGVPGEAVQADLSRFVAAGLLCEVTGLGVPIVAVPLVKDALARHVAFAQSLEVLRGMGVRVMFDPQAPPRSRMPGWPRVLEELHTVTRDGPGGRD